MGGIAGAPCGAVRSSVACVSKSGEHRAQQQKGGGACQGREQVCNTENWELVCRGEGTSLEQMMMVVLVLVMVLVLELVVVVGKA